MRTLAERLKGLQFTTATQSGFIVDRLRPASIEGRFIERHEISQVVENPLGERRIYERTEFRDIGFIISPEYAGLEVINPPRSINLFLSRLAEACNFQISVNEVRLDVIDWCERLATNLGRRVEIVSCQLKDIKISEDITATAILKGNSDVRQSASLVVNGYTYTNDKVKIQVDGTPYYTLILTRQGSATFDQSSSEVLLDSLRTSLYSSIVQR
ncbi:hypothetical protein [Mesorhizobium sp. B2-7-3]|uniref:hypothetical protein n=1 Tax=Mesorhizobium sp. B2-7-3 TaxID=2589907 RepID=UPI00112C7FB7|nr:hypothetical protein [Mesorhizobium sp. B2-7-3]